MIVPGARHTPSFGGSEHSAPGAHIRFPQHLPFGAVQMLPQQCWSKSGSQYSPPQFGSGAKQIGARPSGLMHREPFAQQIFPPQQIESSSQQHIPPPMSAPQRRSSRGHCRMPQFGFTIHNGMSSFPLHSPEAQQILPPQHSEPSSQQIVDLSP